MVSIGAGFLSLPPVSGFSAFILFPFLIMSSNDQGVRLNKYLASCGVGSRRACDLLIQEGRVYVNNAVCLNMGTRVGEDDSVRLGRKVMKPRATEVVLFNKPRGLVCTAHDELGRETIYSVLPPKFQHLKNVGRLDRDSEGLLVLTNDGELALTLTHPRLKVEKEYLVTVDQSFSNEVMEALVAGVHTPEGRAAAKSAKRVSSRRVRVVLVTGMKRQIRVMFEALHLKVTKLVRIRIGTLTGNGLELGKCHLLDEDEIEALRQNPVERRPRANANSEEKKGSGVGPNSRKRGRPPGKRGRKAPLGRPAKKMTRKRRG